MHSWYLANFAYFRAILRKDSIYLSGGELKNIPGTPENLWTICDVRLERRWMVSPWGLA